MKFRLQLLSASGRRELELKFLNQPESPVRLFFLSAENARFSSEAVFGRAGEGRAVKSRVNFAAYTQKIRSSDEAEPVNDFREILSCVSPPAF